MSETIEFIIEHKGGSPDVGFHSHSPFIRIKFGAGGSYRSFETVEGVIDTGADFVFADYALLKRLNSEPKREIEVNGQRGELHVAILTFSGKRGPIFLPYPVIGIDMKAQGWWQELVLGRHFLQLGRLEYDTPQGIFRFLYNAG
jgi:hypothetical protein